MRKDDELDLAFNDVEVEMSYFYAGLQDTLSIEGVFAYCKNKLTNVLDGLMIKILDDLGSESAVKIYE